MESITHYMAKAKKAVRRVGRPSRKDLGQEPIKVITTAVEESVADKVLADHGSIAQGLRFLASMKPVPKAS